MPNYTPTEQRMLDSLKSKPIPEYTAPNAKHVYLMGVIDMRNPDAGRTQIRVHAITRASATRLANDLGYRVGDANMEG